ncbi:DUF2318 domain-containing protein [Candidatus Woesearchaeota archaeon]|nr:DUF2318 domain-containing protein [Candidatus Woesearchaeota archaeon]
MRKELLFLIIISASLIITGCTSSNSDGLSGKVASDLGSSGDGFVSIPLSDLSSTSKFYEYEVGGVKVKYFAVLGSDGAPRTAFDACDVCGGSKGYQQIGSDIRCRNCGRVFSIDGLGSKNKGYGCWPSYLPHQVVGDDVLLNINDIKAGSYRFA